MSYDIYLKDPVTKQTCEIPPHLMAGGTHKAELIDGKLGQTLDTEAHLNITYNYAKWYYAAFEGLDCDKYREFEVGEDGFKGIRSIYGLSGANSIPIIQQAIDRMEDTTWRTDLDVTEETLERDYQEALAQWDDEPEEIKEKLSKLYIFKPEKRNINNYWVETREHALRPLYQLKAMAQLRPDGYWDGD
jgi:hypothetical protein